ncbi:general stress protein [Fictibacillus enclensis]|nr:general stress protein [Fictibacillus enclensis]WHY74554.1 general stress protein [Fictibacillus enclensis]
MGTATKNVFKSKGDKLRSKMKGIGFDQSKAEQLEEVLIK